MAELNATMSPDEFADWQAYDEIETFGSPAEDHRWRQLYSLFFAANFKGKEPRWLDRNPPKRSHKPDAPLDDQIDAVFGAMIPTGA